MKHRPKHRAARSQVPLGSQREVMESKLARRGRSLRCGAPVGQGRFERARLLQRAGIVHIPCAKRVHSSQCDA